MSFARKAVLHAAAWAVFGLPLCAFAVDVVYIPTLPEFPDGLLEAQGFNGRIDLPVNVSTGSGPENPYSNYVMAGATGNSSTLYTLVNSTGPGSAGVSVVLLSNAQTGAYEGALPLSTKFSDIAYTNGQLYGIVQSPTSMQVDSIAANGTTQNLVTQSVTSGNWRLSGVANGDSLLAAFPGSSGNVGFVINPSTLQVSSLSVPSGASESLSNTVINSAGTSFTTLSGNSQFVSSYPGGVPQGTRATNATYAPGSTYSGDTSDEFSMPYPSSEAAIAQVAGTGTSPGLIDGLTRSPQVLTLTANVTLSNGLAPDATTLSNVAASNFNPSLNDPAGSPTPTYQQTFSSPGNFASGTPLGQLTASINLAGAPRGTYRLSSQPTLTANYSYGSNVDTGRPVQTQSGLVTAFAYDPPSANLVGNGDASLQSAGWESQFANLGWQNDSAPQDPITHGFDFLPLPGDAYAIRQFLQLPTPNSAMMLTFSDHLVFNGSATVQVFLNNILVATVTDVSESSAPQQFLINNPALENLSNAPLMFSATLNGSSLTQVEIDNITLTAVPEPGVVSVMILGAMLINGHRRWR